MKRVLIPGAAALLLAPFGVAQWQDLIGKPAPALNAAEWFNVGGDAPSVESLRGEVWLLHFFATW